MNFVVKKLLISGLLFASLGAQASWFKNLGARLVVAGKSVLQKQEKAAFEQSKMHSIFTDRDAVLVSQKEIDNFRCWRFRGCVPQISYSNVEYSKSINSKKISYKQSETALFCKACNTNIKSVKEFQRDQKTGEYVEIKNDEQHASPKNFIDVTSTDVQPQEDLKALPVTSLPANGFWAKCKSMLAKK